MLLIEPRPPFMITSSFGLYEQHRLAALRALELLDTPAQQEFDALTQLAARVLDAPIAAVSLIDEHRQWFKSRVGLDACETSRDLAFCSHTILEAEPMVVPDARLDPRFSQHRSVVGEPGIRFYAGVPIRTIDGHAVGTLCVVDTRPRELSAAQLQTLCDFAALVRREILQHQAAVASRRSVDATSHALEESEARFRSVFECAPVGVALVSTTGYWLSVNRKLCEMLGYSAAELSRLRFQDISYQEHLPADVVALQQLIAGEREQYSTEKRYVRRDGSLVWANLTVGARRRADGVPAYLIAIVEHIDARKAAETALQQLHQSLEQRVIARTAELQHSNGLIRESEAKLRLVLENAYDAYVGIDDAGLIIDWNRQAELTFGWSRGEVLGRSMHETIIPERLRTTYCADMARFLATGRAQAMSQRLQLTAVRRDGREFPIELCMREMRHNGRRMLTAFLHDISERMQHEEALRASRATLQTVADNVPAFISYFDSDLRYRFANAAYRGLLGVEPATLIGRHPLEVFGAAEYEKARPYLERALAGETMCFQVEAPFRGESRYWQFTYVPDRRGQNVVGVHGMAVDVTENMRREIAREVEARRDVLTGLPNRRALFEQLPSAIERADADGCGLALLFIDLDGFKPVNDRLGHQAGDQLLRDVAERLLKAAPSDATVVRLGGDEFTIVAAGLAHGAEDAERIADALLAELRRPFALGDDWAAISGSVGLVIHHPGSGSTADGMLGSADAAMYEAKRAGKDRFRVQRPSGWRAEHGCVEAQVESL